MDRNSMGLTWFQALLDKFKDDPEFIWDFWDLVEDEEPYEFLTCDRYLEIPFRHYSPGFFKAALSPK